MGHEKLTEVSVSYFFIPMLGMKCGTKNKKESNKYCESYGTMDLSFKLKLKLKLIVFFVSQFYASNCFDIINSFCSTGTLTN